MADWDSANPADNDIVSNFPANERAARAAAAANFGVEHHSTNDANVGKHTKVTLLEQSSDPAAADGEGKLYTKAVSGEAELFWRSSTGAAWQVTVQGGLNAPLLAGEIADARLSSNIPRKNASAMFTATSGFTTPTIGAASSNPQLDMQNTSAAANNGRWNLYADSSGVFYLRAIDDAGENGENAITISRSDDEVATIALAADNITLNGVDVTEYPRKGVENTFTDAQKIQGEYTSSIAGVHVALDVSATTTARVLGLTTGANPAPLQFYASTLSYTNGTTERFAVDSSGVFTYGGIEVGYKDIPIYASGDGGGKVQVVSSNQTIDTGIAAGKCYAFYNDSGSAITITQGSGMTLRLAGTTTTGSRTLGPRGWMTVWHRSTTEALCSGPGVT